MLDLEELMDKIDNMTDEELERLICNGPTVSDYAAEYNKKYGIDERYAATGALYDMLEKFGNGCEECASKTV